MTAELFHNQCINVLNNVFFLQIKTTYTIDGNTITQTVRSVNKPERGTATFKREYNGDELVVVSTTILLEHLAN